MDRTISDSPLTAAWEELRRTRDELTHHWLHRVLGRRDAAAYQTLPIEQLFALMPSVVDWIAERLSDPEADVRQVAGPLREVVELLRSRGHCARGVLRDLDLLADILFEVVLDAVERQQVQVAPAEVLVLGRRLHGSFSALGSVVADTYESRGRHELREGRARVEEFVRTLAHELKNPLGAAELAAQMLAEETILSDAEERARYAEMVIRNLKRGGTLIDEMRGHALPDLGFSSAEEWIPLRLVLDDVMHEVAAAAAEHGVSLRTEDVPPDLEVKVPGTRLVVANLVGNAVKYSDPQKPERWVRIRATPSDMDGIWLVHVEDNGLGIAREQQESVFARHFRAHPEIENGTGLGLTIAREAAAGLGGGLWLESEPGQGSTFFAALPGRTASDAGTEREPGDVEVAA